MIKAYLKEIVDLKKKKKIDHFFSLYFRYEHLAKSAPTILDDSLSADSYLNVLHMPSTFPRAERSRRFEIYASNRSTMGPEFEQEPRSNLDSVRYIECIHYIQDVSFT